MKSSEKNVDRLSIEIKNGDIVYIDADAVVCSASSDFCGTYGVEGAIHQAAGRELLKECKSLGHCECGDAKITRGYNLKAKYIIHTVTPYYKAGEQQTMELLTACYRKCIKVAVKNGCKSIAFPMLSTGVKGFPEDVAAHIAISAIVSAAKDYVTDTFSVELIVNSTEFQFDERAFLYLDELTKLALSNEIAYPAKRYAMNNACTVLGAIAGDLAASGLANVHNISSIPKMISCGSISDKTVLTLAVAEGVMDGGEASHFVEALKKWGTMYPNMGYGKRFSQWLNSKHSQPYESYANGAIMRVSPCASRMDLGFYYRTGCVPSYGPRLAKICTEITHNHPEAIEAAETLTYVLFICTLYRIQFVGDYCTEPQYPTLESCKEEIRQFMIQQGYDLSKKESKYDISCRATVISAVNAFLESDSFESAITKALNNGGDYHTITSITGSIAQATYGIPDEIVSALSSRLDNRMKRTCEKWWLRNVEFIRKSYSFDLMISDNIWL